MFGDKEEHRVSHLGKSKLRRLSNRIRMRVHAAFFVEGGKLIYTEHGWFHLYPKRHGLDSPK